MPEETQGQETDTGTEEQTELSEFAQGILGQIPETDRETVGKYLNTWDSNVTKQFEKIHEEYRPFKDLGDYNQVQQAVAVARFLENNPESVYKALHEEFGPKEKPQPQGQGFGQEQEQQTQGQSNPELDELRTMVSTVAQALIQIRDKDSQAEEDRQLDNALSELRKKHGDFDEDYVLVKMMNNGGDGEAAVKDFKALQKAYFSGGTIPATGAKPPPNLGSGGAMPPQTQDVANLSNDDFNELVAKYLQGATEG